jgi:hypothetical protein
MAFISERQGSNNVFEVNQLNLQSEREWVVFVETSTPQ